MAERQKEERFVQQATEIHQHMCEQMEEKGRSFREQEEVDQELLKQRIFQDQKVALQNLTYAVTIHTTISTALFSHNRLCMSDDLYHTCTFAWGHTLWPLYTSLEDGTKLKQAPFYSF